MAELRTQIDIDATCQEVWDVVTDLDRIGDWVTIHHDFPEPPPSDLHEGSRFKQTLGVAGAKFTVEWTATAVEAPKRLSWDGAGPGGSTARTNYVLEDKEGGTRLSYENEFTLPAGKAGKAVAKVVAKQAKRQAKLSLKALKQLIEA